MPRQCSQNRSRLDVERLERRDCPAAIVGVSGGGVIAEGGESVLLTVVLSERQRRAVSVGYMVTGDAVGQGVVSADHTLSVGSRRLNSRSGTIEFRPGEMVKQVRVSAVDDALREGTESLRFSLFRPRGCVVAPEFAKVDLTVSDNDDYTGRLVPQGANKIAEGSSASFVVELSKPATKNETFFIRTIDGSATSDDYRPLRDMPVTLFAGQSRSGPFNLTTIADDDAEENDEFFLVAARPRSPGLPVIDSIGVTIAGKGPAPLEVSVNNVAVVEGNAGTTASTFVIELAAPALSPVTVQYATADGTATAGQDYVAASGSVTFAPGQISKSVTVYVIGETVIEENETFSLLITASGDGSTASATGTGTIQNDDSGFDITLKFVDTQFGSVPENVRALTREAASRWSRVIVGDLPAVPLEGGGAIDDFELTVQMGLLGDPDGVDPETLANARPTKYRDGTGGLPYAGETGLDPGDVSNISTPALREWVFDIITHEIGHALGFASSNPGFRRWVQGTSWTGPNAIREYTTLAGSSQGVVPLETGGGAGTAGAHWAENLFRDELMTGFVARQGVRMPLSRLTVGAFEDLGYSVNYAAAEAYAFVRAGVAARSVSMAAAVGQALEQQRPRGSGRSGLFAGLT